MKTDELVRAFVRGETKGSTHNARIVSGDMGDTHYVLHSSRIATRSGMSGRIEGDWCGFYTTTTANHLRKISRAVNGHTSAIGYASARDEKAGKFTIHEGI